MKSSSPPSNRHSLPGLYRVKGRGESVLVDERLLNQQHLLLLATTISERIVWMVTTMYPWVDSWFTEIVSPHQIVVWHHKGQTSSRVCWTSEEAIANVQMCCRGLPCVRLDQQLPSAIPAFHGCSVRALDHEAEAAPAPLGVPTDKSRYNPSDEQGCIRCYAKHDASWLIDPHPSLSTYLPTCR